MDRIGKIYKLAQLVVGAMFSLWGASMTIRCAIAGTGFIPVACLAIMTCSFYCFFLKSAIRDYKKSRYGHRKEERHE